MLFIHLSPGSFLFPLKIHRKKIPVLSLLNQRRIRQIPQTARHTKIFTEQEIHTKRQGRCRPCHKNPYAFWDISVRSAAPGPAFLRNLERQAEPIAEHGDKFAVCGLSAGIVDGIAKIGVERIHIPSIPCHFDSVADGPLHP